MVRKVCQPRCQPTFGLSEKLMLGLSKYLAHDSTKSLQALNEKNNIMVELPPYFSQETIVLEYSYFFASKLCFAISLKTTLFICQVPVDLPMTYTL